MRLRFIAALLLAVCTHAAELELHLALRWNEAPVVPGDSRYATLAKQEVRITRLSALLSGFALLRPDGSVVRLDGQYGFIDAASGRLGVMLSGVPAGDYQGVQLQIGLPPPINHGDPGQWPAAHSLNPLVNGLHWSWQGGYVFLALEGFWRDAGAETERGFSYHLATDARLMTVRFVAPFHIEQRTGITLALNVASIFGARHIRADDGSSSTHSADGDQLAVDLAHAIERSLFWLGAEEENGISSASLAAPARTRTGTPRAFAVPAGFPQPALPSDNPLTDEGVELGRHLFDDRRLSGNGKQSCASCHDPSRAFSDNVALSRGAEGHQGKRNAMPLFNLAWHPAFAWDGSKPRIRDQVLAAMTNPIEMNASVATVAAQLAQDTELAWDFSAAFGTPEITGERIGLALEQYLLTLVSSDSRFDRAMHGQAQLTADEQRGFELFAMEYDPAHGRRGADCFHCHGGALFSDYGYKSNGLDRGKFKVPSLRNVALTAPYMHDGRFATIEDVIEHYDHGVKRATALDPNLAKHPDEGLKLSPDDKRALVAFLRTLTDERFVGAQLIPSKQ